MKRLTLTLALCSVVVTAQAADPLPRAKPESVGMSSERLANLDKVLLADIERGRLPGAVVAVARRGKLVYYRAFGHLDKDAGVKMTTDAIFSIASMTKPLAAVATLSLYERGLVRIDDPISTYLPEFGKQQVAILKKGEGAKGEGAEAGFDTVPAMRQPTVQDLLRHTSGIIYGGRGATPVHKLYPASSSSAGSTLTGKEFIDKLSTLPLLHQPATTWDYGFGLDLAGLIVERVSGQSLGNYLGSQVFGPLGMKDTAFNVGPDKVKRYAKGFAKDPDTGNNQFVLDLTKPLKFECGGGCAVSTAADYLRFAQMLLQGGQLGGKRVLGRKTVEYMLANQMSPGMVNLIGNADPTRADMGFGLGVAVQTTPGIVRTAGSVGSFSWPGAYGTNWFADPKEQLVVVFMAHTPGPIRWHYRYVVNAIVNQAIVDQEYVWAGSPFPPTDCIQYAV